MRPARGRAAREHGLHADAQLLGAERLAQVVVGAGLEAAATSSSWTRAVSMMIGSVAVAGSARSRRVTS